MAVLEGASWLLHGAELERGEPGRTQQFRQERKVARMNETVELGRQRLIQDILWRQSCLDVERGYVHWAGAGVSRQREREAPGLWAARGRW